MTNDVARTCIFAAAILLPYLVFVVANEFRSIPVTLVRALVAIAVGWAMFIAFVLASQAFSISTASPEELIKIYDGDGAPRAFAAVVGWLPAAVVVLAAWPIHAWLNCRRRHAAQLFVQADR